MRKALVLLGVVAGVAAIGWVAYATTAGVDAVTAASVNTQVCPVPVCSPATEACPSAVTCHDDKTVCPPSCKDCPDFKDSNGDGVCDVVNDCSRHARSGGSAGWGRCGGHTSYGRGCWHSR